MTKGMILAGALFLALGGAALPAGDSSAVQGEYVEARTCDVWTGPCFSNGEINLMGKNAVAGWIVSKGSWGGVTLDGLKVAAAINAQGTLHTAGQGEVTAVMFVDEKADADQAKALVAMAKSLAPKHLANVLKVEKRAIAFSRTGLEAVLTVGDVATIKTTAFCPCDRICCNEEKAYPSISDSAKVECAKTLENAYQGGALDTRWSDPIKRGSMVGTFSR
jgi:uncharacterized protein DUF1326